MESELDLIESVTIDHYNSSADSFWQGTKDHDVSQNYREFLAHLPVGHALDILDFGCGPGRDVLYFKSLGHHPVGLDGSAEFCAMARSRTGCQVLKQNFLSLDLAHDSYDGIFANASMFHIPSQELPRVLGELHGALRAGGILFCSNPRGIGEGWSGQRYGNYMELEVIQGYLENARFNLLKHYYRPEGKPLHQQPWLAIVSQKRDV